MKWEMVRRSIARPPASASGQRYFPAQSVPPIRPWTMGHRLMSSGGSSGRERTARARAAGDAAPEPSCRGRTSGYDDDEEGAGGGAAHMAVEIPMGFRACAHAVSVVRRPRPLARARRVSACGTVVVADLAIRPPGPRCIRVRETACSIDTTTPTRVAAAATTSDLTRPAKKLWVPRRRRAPASASEPAACGRAGGARAGGPLVQSCSDVENPRVPCVFSVAGWPRRSRITPPAAA